jgi:hypothetical protein
MRSIRRPWNFDILDSALNGSAKLWLRETAASPVARSPPAARRRR